MVKFIFSKLNRSRKCFYGILIKKKKIFWKTQLIIKRIYLWNKNDLSLKSQSLILKVNNMDNILKFIF